MAATVTIDFDAQNDRVVVTGDASFLMRQPLFGAYVREAGGGVASPTTIAIPTDQQTLHVRYQDLEKLLKRLGIELNVADEISESLKQVQSDERAFDVFSSAAEAIWHRRVEPEHFGAFVSVVADRCGGRGFYRKQLLAAYHLAFAQHACNFSVPGAGKTSIVYAAFAYLNSLDQSDPRWVDRILVAGPLSSFKAWEHEWLEVFNRPARSRRIAGFTTQADRRAYLRGLSFVDRNADLTLTTYATLASNAADFARFLQMPAHRTMMVLDEAHNIKREDGYWAAAALDLAPYATSRVVLTGTPAPNGYEDLANLFRFVYPKKNIIGFSASTLKAMSSGVMPAAVQKLKSRVRPFYTRIRKSDLGLPPAEEHRWSVSLSESHRRIYSGIERALIPQIRAAIQGGRSSLVRARLMRLRQAAVNPSLLLRPLEEEGLLDPDASASFSVSELEIAELVSQFRPQNLLRLQEAVALTRRALQAEGKVVVWSYFIGNLHLLKAALQGAADFVEIVTGSTPVANDQDDEAEEAALPTREAIIERFHDSSQTSVLIANPQAVGESISLHKASRTAIYFDRDFNAGRFIQSKDRIHRYNPRPLGDVTYIFMVAPNTIDAVIDQRLVLKEQRLADLIDSEEIPLFTLGSDDSEESADIRAILEDYERRKAI